MADKPDTDTAAVTQTAPDKQPNSGAQTDPKASPVAVPQSGADKADARAAAGEQTEHEKAAAAEPSLEDRARALVAAFSHALEHNAPRTTAELAELKSLLGVADDGGAQSA